MTPDKKTLIKLRASLPAGSSWEIQTRILEKTGKKYAISYITQVLNPNDKRKNPEIFEEALLLAEELKKEKEELSQRVAALK